MLRHKVSHIASFSQLHVSIRLILLHVHEVSHLFSPSFIASLIHSDLCITSQCSHPTPSGAHRWRSRALALHRAEGLRRAQGCPPRLGYTHGDHRSRPRLRFLETFRAMPRLACSGNPLRPRSPDRFRLIRGRASRISTVTFSSFGGLRLIPLPCPTTSICKGWADIRAASRLNRFVQNCDFM
jgi:hypothetical protein